MRIERFFLVATIVLLAGTLSGRLASSSAAEPVASQPTNTPAAQTAAAKQADDVARASALLAEFRTAKTEEERWSSRRVAARPADTRRSQIEVGRDLTKLNRSAVPLLIKTLDDPDNKVSAVAALALGRIGDPRAVDPMLKVLHSFIPVLETDSESPIPPRQLRAQACVCALGQLREPRAVWSIVALERMRDERSDLIEELGFQDHSWSYMCGIMPIVCGDAIERIGEPAAPELLTLLSSGSGEIRASAAGHLGNFGIRDRKFRAGMLMTDYGNDEGESDLARDKREASERVVSDRVAKLAGGKLIELFRDKEMGVRRAATTAVGNLRIAAAVGPLIKRLQDEQPWVRLDAIESLGQIGDPAAFDALAPLLKNPGPDQSDSAELSVAMIGGPKAFALLKSGLENTEPQRREAAVHGLFELGTADAIHLIIVALRDNDRNVRCEAVQVLGRVRGTNAAPAVEPLIVAVNDEDESVRVLAMRALSEIADPRAVDIALAALKQPSWQMREAGVEALGRIKSARSVSPVKAMLNDPVSSVRLEAVIALSELNPPDLADCLRALLTDKDKGIREIAADCLSKLTKPAPEKSGAQ